MAQQFRAKTHSQQILIVGTAQQQNHVVAIASQRPTAGVLASARARAADSRAATPQHSQWVRLQLGDSLALFTELQFYFVQFHIG